MGEATTALSARVARLLVKAGYSEDRVAVLSGGIGAWQQADYPMVRWEDSA